MKWKDVRKLLNWITPFITNKAYEGKVRLSPDEWWLMRILEKSLKWFLSQGSESEHPRASSESRHGLLQELVETWQRSSEKEFWQWAQTRKFWEWVLRRECHLVTGYSTSPCLLGRRECLLELALRGLRLPEPEVWGRSDPEPTWRSGQNIYTWLWRKTLRKSGKFWL